MAAGSDYTAKGRPRNNKMALRLLTALRFLLQTRSALIAEKLFLRKQLPMFQECNVRPRRAKPCERLALIALARFLNRREEVAKMKEEIFIGWLWPVIQEPPQAKVPVGPHGYKRLIGCRVKTTTGARRVAPRIQAGKGRCVARIECLRRAGGGKPAHGPAS